MTNPALINLTRGGRVESLHRGAIAICDAQGNAVARLGDVKTPIFPRSAIKALQALPLVESGAAEAAGFSDAELALACASHSGEPVHVGAAGAMLAKLGLGPEALRCGTQWPLEPSVARELARSGGTPGPLHNNCSGKHAGMLALAQHIGADVADYEKPDHPVQLRIRSLLEEMTGETLGTDVCGIDGCSVPTWAASLEGFACAFAKLAIPATLPQDRRRAAERLVAACIREPHMVEGEGRFGTGVMRRLGRDAFMKGGAEGVYCAAFPQAGVGIALKIDDGAKRGAEAVAAHVVATLLQERVANAGEIFRLELKNWSQIHIGDIEPSEELSVLLEELSAIGGLS